MQKRSLSIWFLLVILLATASGQEYYRIDRGSLRGLRSGLEEAAAVPYQDRIVYIQESTSVGISSPTNEDGKRLFTIYEYNENTRLKKPFIDALVTERHEGPVSFTADFGTMVFCQHRPAPGNRDGVLKLFFADNVDGQWTNIREYEHNDETAWYFSPCLSSDGRLLFFAANLEGGMGGFDIYVSRQRGGSWTEPENLGPGVNSEAEEIYPYYHSPTGELTFSSAGRDGDRGGFDLFRSKQVDGVWAEAVKLMTPFNSPADDYHLWMSEDLKTGYLTTDRTGGNKSIFYITTDIPNIESPEPIKKTYYKYKIYDRKLDTVDTDLFRYSWVINDTLELPGHEVIYEFPGPGRYVCKLNVYDIQLDTLVEGQTVNTLNIRLHEQAVITCPDTLRTNVPVTFDAGQTNLPGVDVARYVWDFGDGTFGQGLSVEHAYLYPGKYRVVLGVEAAKEDSRRRRPEYEIIAASFRDIVVVAQ